MRNASRPMRDEVVQRRDDKQFTAKSPRRRRNLCNVRRCRRVRFCSSRGAELHMSCAWSQLRTWAIGVPADPEGAAHRRLRDGAQQHFVADLGNTVYWCRCSFHRAGYVVALIAQPGEASRIPGRFMCKKHVPAGPDVISHMAFQERPSDYRRFGFCNCGRSLQVCAVEHHGVDCD